MRRWGRGFCAIIAGTTFGNDPKLHLAARDDKPMIARIEPILLFVKDFERSLAFYRDVVGLRVKNADGMHEGYAEFDVGGTTFALHGGYERAEKTRHSEGPLALHFWTEDIQATVKRLKDKGVKITREPKWEEFGAWEAAFEDPEGNEWGLVQEG